MKTIEVETAKKIKALGVKKKSYALWRHRIGYDEDTAYIITQNCIDDCYLTTNDDILYPAYTLDEILEMLPSYITHKTGANDYRLILERKWQPSSYKESGFIVKYFYQSQQAHKNPAEAAAKLLIWCIENGYVTNEEINK